VRAIALFVIAVALAAIGRGASYVHVDGQELVGADGKVLRIKGTNLGNWLVPEGYMWRLEKGPSSPHEIESLLNLLLGPDKAAEFWRDYRDRYVTRADVEFLAKAGCNTLRVPLHYKFFLDPKGEGFRLLDRVVSWSHEFGVYVILDLHCAPGGQTGTNIDDSLGYPWLYESTSAQAELLTVWENIARHYRDNPTVLGYDLLNEPLPAFPGWEKYKPMLEPLLERVRQAVRAIDPNHVVFLTGANWDSDFKVLEAPPERNVAYTFHKYWVPPDAAAIAPYVAYREKYNVPIWCGETGENKDEWVASFRKLLDENRIGWTFWPYKKMESRAGFVRFERPANWDKIVTFARQPAGTGSDQVKANLPLRPTPEEVAACFAELLEHIQFAHCQPNQGYIEALGLTVPAP
jgi:endoglucanase